MHKHLCRKQVLFSELNWSHTAIHRSDPWIPPTHVWGRQTKVKAYWKAANTTSGEIICWICKRGCFWRRDGKSAMLEGEATLRNQGSIMASSHIVEASLTSKVTNGALEYPLIKPNRATSLSRQKTTCCEHKTGAQIFMATTVASVSNSAIAFSCSWALKCSTCWGSSFIWNQASICPSGLHITPPMPPVRSASRQASVKTKRVCRVAMLMDRGRPVKRRSRKNCNAYLKSLLTALWKGFAYTWSATACKTYLPASPKIWPCANVSLPFRTWPSLYLKVPASKTLVISSTKSFFLFSVFMTRISPVTVFDSEIETPRDATISEKVSAFGPSLS